MVVRWFADLDVVEVLLGKGYHEFCSNTLHMLDAGAGGMVCAGRPKTSFGTEKNG
jgi:hypothetical protein